LSAIPTIRKQNSRQRPVWDGTTAPALQVILADASDAGILGPPEELPEMTAVIRFLKRQFRIDRFLWQHRN